MRPNGRNSALSLAFVVLTALAVAVALAAALADAAPAIDTVGQFAAPALTAAVLGSVLALSTRRPWTAAALAAASLALAVELLPQWTSPPQAAPAPNARPVKVYFDNLWTRNRDGDAIRRSIAAADADVVALVQVSDLNARYVRQALAAYPYRLEPAPAFGRRGPRRTVVAARFPLKEAPSRFVGQVQPGYGVEVAAPAPFRLVVVHLQRPWPYRGQDEHFEALRKDLAEGGAAGRTVMVGDFNATLSSAALRRFRRDTGLTALPAPFGDWPSVLPAPLRLGIENVLAGQDLVVSDRRLGLPSGSDHRPLVFQITPAAPRS